MSVQKSPSYEPFFGKNNMLKFAHDKKAKALYVYVAKKKVASTEVLGRNFMVDKDKKGNIVGVEILGAEQLPGSKKVKVLLDLAQA